MITPLKHSLRKPLFDILTLGLALFCFSLLELRGENVSIIAWGSPDDTSGNPAGVTSPPSGLTNVTQISAGGGHSLALAPDGSVFGWGDDRDGQSTIPTGLSNVVEVAAGFFHSLALKSDGTVTAWGSNVSGETNIPAGLSNVVAISANGCSCLPNGNKSLALKADGTVIGWGATAVPAGLSNVVAISAGGNHALALTRDGQVVGWGSNANGRSTPPASLSNVVAIAAGGSHSLALTAAGNVVAWGNNAYGQTNVPPGLTDVVSIAAGDDFCLALKRDGTVTGWGYDFAGQASVPPGLNNVVAIAAGSRHSVALVNDGSPVIVRRPNSQTIFTGETIELGVVVVSATPVTYRWQVDGSILQGETNATLLVPNAGTNNAGTYTVVVSNVVGTASASMEIDVLSSAPIIEVQPTNQFSVFGSNVSFSVRAAGSAPLKFQWLRNESVVQGATNSTLVLSNLTFADVGNYCLMISNLVGTTLSSNATLNLSPVVSWGAGALNSNVSPDYGQSIVPLGTSNAISIAAGGYHNVALKADGKVAAWGWNGRLQTNSPFGLNTAKDVAAGLQNSLALRSNGTITAWGDSFYGQNAVPSATNFATIRAGWYHVLALTSNRTVFAWGAGKTIGSSPHFGQSIVPPGLSNVVAIAGGGYHSLALKADGTVVAWGLNASGQTNVPLSLSNVVAIAAGSSNSLALRDDGSIVAWGDNTYGQTDIPAAATDIVAIAAGAGHNLALRADGRLIAWGLNGNNQTNVPSALSNVIAIAAGANHSLALVGSGQIVFLIQPRSQSHFKGGSLMLSAGVVGARPLYYQWQLDGADLAGETNRLLTINNAQVAQSGNYQLIASNGYGAVTSSVAVVAINDTAPFFTVQPSNQSVLAKSNVVLVSSAGGVAPISFQWLFNDAPLPDKTNSTLSITNAQAANEGFYSVMASNSFGTKISSNAYLDVVDLGESLDATNLIWGTSTNPPWLPQTNITHGGFAAASSGPLVYPQQSTLRTTVIGPGTLTFWWMASGYGGTTYYRFYINGTNVAVLSPIGWQQKTFYLPDGSNDLQWIFNKSDTACCANFAGYLDEVSYVPGGTPAFVLTPFADRIANAGTNVTFSVGAGGTPPFRYEWQFSGSDIPGATNSSLTLNNVQAAQAGSYSVIFSNSYGVANTGATLTIAPAAPSILTQPSNQEMVSGGTVIFSVAARGSEPLCYQWQFNNADLSNATNASLALSAVQTNDTGSYRVIVRNAYGTNVSSAATLTIVPTVIVGWGSVFTSSPNPPPGLTNVAGIAAGDNFSIALKNDSTVYAWGWNAFGKLSVPANLTNVSMISAGENHGSTLISDGTVTNWGESFFDAASIVPEGISNVIKVSAGGRFNLALKDDGTVIGWGDNFLNPLPVPAGLSNVVDIATGHYHSLALTRDGRVIAWGYNAAGQTNVPPGLSNIVAISAGYLHSMALKDDGTVVVWGTGSSGLTNVPADIGDVVDIAAGWQHCLALRRNGTVVAWGNEGSGRTDVPPWLTNVVAIAAGNSHSLSLLNDGSPYIVRQPWTQTVPAGADVEFRVVAMGHSPFSYQWQFNGTNIDGATNSLLKLTNAPLSASGNYHCIVSNAVGMRASSVASLSVLRALPHFLPESLGFHGDEFRLTIGGLSGVGEIVLFMSTNLTGWQPILTNPPVLGTFQFTDPDTSSASQRFYRIQEQ